MDNAGRDKAIADLNARVAELEAKLSTSAAPTPEPEVADVRDQDSKAGK